AAPGTGHHRHSRGGGLSGPLRASLGSKKGGGAGGRRPPSSLCWPVAAGQLGAPCQEITQAKRYQRLVLPSQTNLRAVVAAMTSLVPSATCEVPEAANVTVNADSLMTVRTCPATVPAARMIPVTLPVGATVTWAAPV